MQRLLSLAGAWLLFACASMVHAQAWPTKPVRWIVPFPPGSTSDITAWVLSERLSADLGATLKQPEVKAKLESLGGEIVAMPHEAFAPRYRSDFVRWGKAIRDVGIKLD